MKYKTINELYHFRFGGAYIAEVRMSVNSLTMLLDNVIILPENSKNRDIREMRANGLLLTFAGGELTDFIEEGYKLYDAGGSLKHQDPDRRLLPEEYAKGFQTLSGCTIYSIEKNEDSYDISVDTEDHTFFLRVSGCGDMEEWERFLNVNSEF